MRRTLVGFGMFLLGVFLLSAIFSPPAFWLCDYFFPNFFPFRRVFNRTLMIGALAMLYPLALYWKINSWEKLGISSTRWKQRWLGGLLLGISTMVILCVPFFKQYAGNSITAAKILQIIISALLVGFLEEILFRGMFFYALKDFLNKSMPLWALITSSFYAKAHFIKAEDLDGAVNWLSGWQMWLHVWPSMNEIPSILPEWLNLFFVGLVLCAVVWRTKSIWLAMGLHTGWVIILLTSSQITFAQNFSLREHLLKSSSTTLFLICILVVILLQKRPLKE